MSRYSYSDESFIRFHRAGWNSKRSFVIGLAGFDRVVPIRARLMGLQSHPIHLVPSHFLPLKEDALQQRSLNRKASFRGRPTYVT